MSDKTVKTLLIVAVLAVGGYLAYRWYKNYQAGQTGGGVPQLGTNLNSVAPELVGGSSGPAVAPAANIPVTISITDNRSSQSEMPETPNTPMIPAGVSSIAPLGQPTNNQINDANPGDAEPMPEDAATVTPLVKRDPKVTAPIRRERERRGRRR